jgi:hypothetical protein
MSKEKRVFFHHACMIYKFFKFKKKNEVFIYFKKNLFKDVP